MSPRFVPSELFLKAQTDERLLALAGQGHGRAFAVLVERRRGALLAHAQRMVGAERGEDVLQQTLLRAWTSLQRGLEVRHAQAWLHRIVHNVSLSEIERQVQATEPLDEQLPGRGSVVVDAEQRFEARQVLEGLASLPERQRLALLGTELEGRSRRELAAELGLSEGAVRQLVHRARAGVRAAVAAVVPLPLLTRLMKGGGWLPGPDAAGGLRPGVEAAAASSLLVGGAAKAGTALLAIGALGGGLLLHGGAGRRHGHTSASTVPHRAHPTRSAVHLDAGRALLGGVAGLSSAATAGAATTVGRHGAGAPVLVRSATAVRLRHGAGGAGGVGEGGGGAALSALRPQAGEDGSSPAASSPGASSPGASSREGERVPSREDGGSPSSGSGPDGRTGADGASRTSTSESGGSAAPPTLSSDGESSGGELSTAGGSSDGGAGTSD